MFVQLYVFPRGCSYYEAREAMPPQKEGRKIGTLQDLVQREVGCPWSRVRQRPEEKDMVFWPVFITGCKRYNVTACHSSAQFLELEPERSFETRRRLQRGVQPASFIFNSLLAQLYQHPDVFILIPNNLHSLHRFTILKHTFL